METPHFNIHSQKASYFCQNHSRNPSLPSSYFHHWEPFWPIFHHRRRKKKQLGARSHRHRISATDSTNLLIGGNINKIQLYISLLFCFTLFCFSLVYFHLYYRTATKESRFLSRCSLAQARVKTLATVLATPLSLFTFIFIFLYCTLVYHFRPP